MSDYNSSLPIRTENNGDVVVKLGDGTTPSQQLSIDTDGRGAVKVDGDYDGVANATPSSAGIIAHDRGASIDETSQNQRLTAVPGASDSVCLDISLHDEAGAAFSDTNALPVKIIETEGTEVCSYDTSAAIAANASDNHDYTTGAAMTLKKVWASASGKLKVEVQTENAAGGGVFTTRFVGFNSTATPNIDFAFPVPVVVVSGAIVRVIRTNKDNQAQDVYSTIIGLQ
jgi:hypothetical protein